MRRRLAWALARVLRDTDLSAALVPALQPQVRAIWTPTAAGYFSRLAVPTLDEIFHDLAPDHAPEATGWTALKKSEKAGVLHDLFNNADWREALGVSREHVERIDAWVPAELTWGPG